MEKMRIDWNLLNHFDNMEPDEIDEYLGIPEVVLNWQNFGNIQNMPLDIGQDVLFNEEKIKCKTDLYKYQKNEKKFIINKNTFLCRKKNTRRYFGYRQ
jgi:hypothetical protein